jgi:hypothetical protein
MLLHHLLVGLPAFARSVVHVGLSADQADATGPLLQEEPERLPGRQPVSKEMLGRSARLVLFQQMMKGMRFRRICS